MGESMQAYFGCMEVERSRAITKETSHDRQKRLSRETAMRNFPIPGRRGPIVFLWIDCNGFRVRTRCSRQVVRENWTEYHDTMRRYDSIHDEWDLCTEFSPEDDHSTVASLPRLSGVRNFGTQSIPPRPPTSPTPLPHQLLSDDGSPDHIFDSFIPSIYYRYGFLLSTTESHPDLGVTGWGLRDVRKYILDGQSSLVEWDDRTSAFICAFFYALALGIGLNASNSDLFDNSPNPISLPAAPVVLPVMLDNEQFFQFRFLCDHLSGWSIYLRDPASVLQILRQQWYDEPSNLLVQLLQHGIGANTYITSNPSNPISPSLLRPRTPASELDWRSMKYEFYEEARATVLSRPYARAALLKGGILARLARENLDVMSAVQGPSIDVFSLRTSRRSSDGWLYWDDDLSTSEMNLICGVYKLPTSQGVQTADMSWWPKQSMWVGSNVDVGYWSPDNEVWFRACLSKIQAGEAQPMNATRWANALKKYRYTSRIVQSYRSAAATFLSECLHTH